jgi:hypothetical protein
LSGTYQWNVGEGRAWVRGDVHFLDQHELEFANKPELTNDSQSIVNASLNYAFRNFQVSAYGHNLTKEDDYGIGFDVAGL